MRVLADVNVSRHVVTRLRASGFDALRVPEVLDPRAADADIIACALRIDAVIVSHDQDFTNLLAATGASRPSLINRRVSYVDAARLAASIATVLLSAGADLARGAIVTLEDGGFRIHGLPVGQ